MESDVSVKPLESRIAVVCGVLAVPTGDVSAVKDAVAVFPTFIDNTHESAPLQSPLHPLKFQPPAGVAVNVTFVPLL
jgi:hypothetical protein